MLFNQKILCLVSLIIGFSIDTTTHAGDTAKLRVIGFSPNSKYFAFEQFGIQDGSGFPYSDIFIIDTASDNWVAGTPIRVEVEDEFSSLSAARKLSAQRAKPLLIRFNLYQSQSKNQLLGHPVEQSSKDTNQISFKVAEMQTPDTPETHDYLLALNQWEHTEAQCQGYGVMPKLFSLSLTQEVDSQSKTRLLHQDSGLPRSRGCPMDYAINTVVISKQNKDKPAVIAVILNVYLMGFEGHNRRFLAITAQLD